MCSFMKESLVRELGNRIDRDGSLSSIALTITIHGCELNALNVKGA